MEIINWVFWKARLSAGYRARFIGARARERYKLEQIEILDIYAGIKKQKLLR